MQIIIDEAVFNSHSDVATPLLQQLFFFATFKKKTYRTTIISSAGITTDPYLRQLVHTTEYHQSSEKEFFIIADPSLFFQIYKPSLTDMYTWVTERKKIVELAATNDEDELQLYVYRLTLANINVITLI